MLYHVMILVILQDVMFPGLRPQPPLPQADRETKYIAFVSGLDVGDPAGNPTRLSLLLDFLTGMLGSSTEQATASKVFYRCHT